MRWRHGWAAVLVLLGSSACESTADGGEPGLGNEGGTGGVVRCTVDQASEPAAALPLSLGVPSGENFLCPPLDEDWFRFDLPAGQPLVTVELAFPVGATSPVELAYEIYRAVDPSTAVAFAADEITGDNRSAIARSHHLGSEGGAFLVKVRDAGNDDEDPRNAYSLRITAAADPDPNEPNDSCATATPIGASATGTLAWEGDRDAFVVPVSGSQILDVQLRSAGPTPVDLQLTLYGADGNFLDARADSFGDDGNDVALRQGVQSTRPLCLVVADVDGDEADPATAYTLTVALADETDVNDRDVRNDTPDAATLLQDGIVTSGRILSRGDQDWFRIDAAPGDIAEVEVSCDGCDLELAVNLVYGHEGSPCEAGDSCDYLLSGNACGAGDACGSGVCRQTPEGPLCGAGCGGDLDCPSFQCQRTAGVAACVGGAICVPDGADGGSCGVVQYGVIAPPGTSQQIRYAQPVLRGGPVYLLVHDFHDDEWSEGEYQVRVRLRPDPDVNEADGVRNNFYLPFTDVASLPDALRKGRDLATPAPFVEVIDPDSLELVGKTASGSGCIGYSADVDVFRLEGGNPCAEGNCALELAFDRPPGGGLDLAYFLLNEGMQPRTSLLESQQGDDHLFGDDACVEQQAVECNVYSATDSGDYFLVVYDQGLDAWDESGAHCYTWTVTAAVMPGCPAACPNVHEVSGLCTCE